MQLRSTMFYSANINAISRALSAAIGALALLAATGCRAQTYTPAFANVEYALVNSKSLQLDIYLPTPIPASAPVVVWLHGGGWYSGVKYPCDAAALSAAGYAVVSPYYRLSTEAVWPAQIYDCKAVIRWVRANASFYHFDSNRIAVLGFSAGGHLAALLGTTGELAALEGSEGYTGYSSKVQAAISWSGPTDLTTEDSQKLSGSTADYTSATAAETRLLGCSVLTCPDKALAASPVSYASSDDPPFLLVHGAVDMTIPPLQSQELYNRLVQAGVVDSTLWFLPGIGHDGAALDATIPALQNWLDRHFKAGYQANAYTMVDLCRALRASAGLGRSSAADLTRMANPPSGKLDITAAARIARKVAGLSPNP